MQRSIQLLEPGFVNRKIVPGDHGSETGRDPGPKTIPQKTKSRIVTLVAEEIVNHGRAIQADFKMEPGIRNQEIRQAGRKNAAGHNLYLAGMVKSRSEDFRQIFP